MSYRSLLAAVVVAGAVILGCEKKEEPKVTAPTTPTVPQAEAPKAPAVAASVGEQEAQSKLDQISQYIKDKKFDLAEAALKQLESSKTSLPQAIQEKLPAARMALDAAKMSGMKMPEMPKL